VLIGSRDAGRARDCADGLGHSVKGTGNAEACASDLVIIAVPWSAHSSTISGLAPHLVGRLVVDAVNPLGFDDRGPYAIRVEGGSAAEEAQLLLPSSIVVGAFHHVSGDLLRSAGALDTDVLVAGDDRDAIRRVTGVVDSVAGMRGVYAGRLRNCGQLEALAANLIAINRRYRTQAGLRVTGISD
jgi:NADPH-dependent F420 reductase